MIRDINKWGDNMKLSKKTVAVIVIAFAVSIILGPNVMWKLNSTLSNVNSLMYNIDRLEQRFGDK